MHKQRVWQAGRLAPLHTKRKNGKEEGIFFFLDNMNNVLMNACIYIILQMLWYAYDLYNAVDVMVYV